MAHTLPLHDMSVEEKLKVMETLWEDLSQNAPELAPPSWHREVLAERRAAAERGEDHFSDWNEARERIEKEIR